jgi:hypothetical protein
VGQLGVIIIIDGFWVLDMDTANVGDAPNNYDYCVKTRAKMFRIFGWTCGYIF